MPCGCHGLFFRCPCCHCTQTEDVKEPLRLRLVVIPPMHPNFSALMGFEDVPAMKEHGIIRQLLLRQPESEAAIMEAPTESVPDPEWRAKEAGPRLERRKPAGD